MVRRTGRLNGIDWSTGVAANVLEQSGGTEDGPLSDKNP